MVGGCTVQLASQFGAAKLHDLVGMDLQLEALLASGLEVTPRLLDGEDVLLAEDVGKLGQPFLGN